MRVLALLPTPPSILALRTRSLTLKKLFQILLVSLGCLHLAGGPYSLMQVYAWAGMLVSYSKHEGLLQGAKDTFSGEKPCALCCKIAEAKKADGSQEKKDVPLPSSISAGKILQDFLPCELVSLKPPRFTESSDISFPGLCVPVETAGASPPVPPPRFIA